METEAKIRQYLKSDDDITLKHLSGQHNQKKHGNRGATGYKVDDDGVTMNGYRVDFIKVSPDGKVVKPLLHMPGRARGDVSGAMMSKDEATNWARRSVKLYIKHYGTPDKKVIPGQDLSHKDMKPEKSDFDGWEKDFQNLTKSDGGILPTDGYRKGDWFVHESEGGWAVSHFISGARLASGLKTVSAAQYLGSQMEKKLPKFRDYGGFSDSGARKAFEGFMAKAAPGATPGTKMGRDSLMYWLNDLFSVYG